ncbi:MAG: hypothetical protein AAFR67_08935 [Chloroflexota bacterium]
MALAFVTGDPLLTTCKMLGFGHNQRAGTEVTPLFMHLMRQYPPAFADYEQACRKARQKSGQLHIWRESMPELLFMTVRDSHVGATRLRYVQACLLVIARDYRLHGIESLAIAPLGDIHEQADILPLFRMWLNDVSIPVVVYKAYTAGVKADESKAFPQ